ncbi:MAG: HU family DNA-binding protein [Deltaproteobacteria bacterium]|nr:HU family DNA-binding protein [Deltaproteobacteria bacterium]
MTTDDLIAQIALDTGLTKAEVQKVITSLSDSIVKAVKNDVRLSLSGLGVFAVAKRPKRGGRNPRTGAPLTI